MTNDKCSPMRGKNYYKLNSANQFLKGKIKTMKMPKNGVVPKIVSCYAESLKRSCMADGIRFPYQQFSVEEIAIRLRVTAKSATCIIAVID
ncbi:unnamed protein product [Wuchereria bancrofti]|uniref:Uncharacterized protein n=1 Tax=Wuchereria bancrofti TaxID=6293 RepID=A0A3P7G9U2_WUCBA|nr:unnamed protein product [Wuchereria bancrofti]